MISRRSTRLSTKRILEDDNNNLDSATFLKPNLPASVTVSRKKAVIGGSLHTATVQPKDTNEDPDDVQELLEDHLIACGDSDMSYTEENESLNDTENTTLNTSIASISSSVCKSPSLLLASTPKRKNALKKPAPDSKFLTCPRCPKKKYKTEKGLEKHMFHHSWQDAAKKMPCHDTVMEHCKSSSPTVLHLMLKDISCGFWGDLNKFIETLLSKVHSKEWVEFLAQVCLIIFDLIKPKKTLFASSLRLDVLVGINKAFADLSVRENLVCALEVLHLVDINILWLFLHDFLVKMGDSVVTFVAMTIRGSDVTKLKENPQVGISGIDFKSLDAKQTIHHIGGACTRGFMRSGVDKKKESNRWKQRVECIKGCFLDDDCGKVERVPEEIKEWTASISRGKLLFIGAHAFNFFFAVAEIVASCEVKHGSVVHTSVLFKCQETYVIPFLWDELVGSSLKENESLSFMISVITSFTNVYGSGIIKRRMNSLVKTGNIAFPLRKAIAR